MRQDEVLKCLEACVRGCELPEMFVFAVLGYTFLGTLEFSEFQGLRFLGCILDLYRGVDFGHFGSSPFQMSSITYFKREVSALVCLQLCYGLPELCGSFAFLKFSFLF